MLTSAARLLRPTLFVALVAGLIGLAGPLPASAAASDVKITEWQYSGSEFVEFTNIGAVPADMSGWSFSDDGRTPGEADLSAFGTLAVGESAILAEDAAETFRASWGLPAEVKIIGSNTANLGRADEINLYDATNALVDRLTYDDQGSGTVKGPRTDSASAWVPADAVGANTASAWVKSTVADSEGSWQHSGGFIGSPGVSTLAPGDEPEEPEPSAGTVLSAGQQVTCALTAEDELSCWGRGNEGVVGSGTLDRIVPSPVAVSTAALAEGERITDIAMGRTHACGLTDAGTAYCWGVGEDGELGDGTETETQPVPTPVDMAPLGGDSFTQLGIRDRNTCGVTTANELFCWGNDFSSAVPLEIDTSALPAGRTIETLTSGIRYEICGLLDDGTAFCLSGSSAPALVSTDLKFDAITAGQSHTCGISEGSAYCWGWGILLGTGSSADSDTPLPVDAAAVPGGTFVDISASVAHTCGIASDGSAWCWGRGGNGSLGSLPATDRLSPHPVDVSSLPEGTTFASISAGASYTCAVTVTDAVYCWGDDGYGQLGNGPDVTDMQPVPSVQVDLEAPTTLPTIVAAHPYLTGAVGDPTTPGTTLTVDDPDTDPADLTVTAEGADPAILPSENITITGDGTERTVALTPVAQGYTEITFRVTDPDGNTNVAKVGYMVSNQIPDPTGRYHVQVSDASAALDVGDGHMMLLNDETNSIYLHRMDVSGGPVDTTTFTVSQLATDDEIDFEGIDRNGDFLVMSGSHGNNRSGEVREERRRLVGATITGSGADTQVTWTGTYTRMWDDLKVWDAGDGHGLGANALKFDTGTRPSYRPNPPDGFNIEAVEFSPDGEELYLGFRAPTITVGGSQMALVVPLLNPEALLQDGLEEEAGLAEFGDPILLDLDGRSIRAIQANDNGQYLINAGPSPSNDTWALYTWDGDPDHQPDFNQILPAEDPATTGVWEAIAIVPDSVEEGAVARLVTDSGDSVFGKNQAVHFQKSYSQDFVLGPVEWEIDPEPATVTGAVTDGTDPVADACVYLYSSMEAPSASYASCANPDGSFAISGVTPGSYTVAAADPTGRHETYWSSEPVMIDADTEPLALTLSPVDEGAIVGTITDGDDVVAGAWVLAHPHGESTASRATASSGDGAYWLGGVDAGDYDIAFYDPSGNLLTQWWTGTQGGAPLQSGAVAVTVTGAETVTGIDAVLSAPTSGVVTGTITDASGPIAGACVYLYATSEGPASYATCTGADGSYWIGDVPAGTAFKLAAADPTAGHLTQWWTGTAGGASSYEDAVTLPELTAGGTTIADLVMEVDATGGIAGTIASASTALGDVCVYLYEPGDTAGAAFASCSLADGTYRVSQVDEGDYEVAFFDPAGGYLTQWWTGSTGGAAVRSGASPVMVGTSIVPDIDAQLAPVA